MMKVVRKSRSDVDFQCVLQTGSPLFLLYAIFTTLKSIPVPYGMSKGFRIAPPHTKCGVNPVTLARPLNANQQAAAWHGR